MSWWGNIESYLHLKAIIFLHQPAILKDTWKTQFLNFMKPRRTIQSWPPQTFFGNITNTHPFEDRNARICHLIFAYVLIPMKYCLFPVILSSFHTCGRRHYIRAVKIFDRKPSMLYTMIIKSLVHCCDNFEQNARILAQC